MRWWASNARAKLSSLEPSREPTMKTTGMGWRARAALALIAGLAAGAANAQGMQQAAPAQSAPKQQSAGSPSGSNGSTSNPSAPQQKLYKNEELDQMMA